MSSAEALDISDCKTALNLFTQEEISLIKLLDCCKTPKGSKLLHQWVENPLIDIPLISQRLDKVEFFYNSQALLTDLQIALKKVPDLDSLISKFNKFCQGKKGANLEDCVRFYHFAQDFMAIANLILQHSLYYKENFAAGKEQFSNLIELVEKGIDLEHSSMDQDYRVNPNFSPELKEIHEEIKAVEKDIENCRIKATKDLGLSKELKLVPSQTSMWLLEGNKKEIHISLRENPDDRYIIVSHKQNTVTLTCIDLKKCCQRKESLSEEFQIKQVQLVDKIIEFVSSYLPVLVDMADVISELDAILSFAYVALKAPEQYTRPILNDSGYLSLKDSRHPSLERMTTCIPNDADFEISNQSIAIITGPNMGGKTTYLKQIGLCCIMAHCGCFVPCSSAHIPIFDRIITRIGAEDNCLMGISTFMAEMKDMAKLFETVTKKSLVLIDELGRGTSTNEGLGLAWGFVQELAEIGCITLFATHFSELSSLQHPKIKNLHTDIKISQGNILMLYKIIPAPMSWSFGLECAKLAGMNEEIIKLAEDYKQYMEPPTEEVRELFEKYERVGYLSLDFVREAYEFV
ncbi:unnamed protein product [Blepharisma stoltei]|uniref:DNA mismatch repair proteins mutS family domain-containing protein n=1 Tax=Blepharisma stoltei TaxID=1481888 RepID=A0AAU9IFP5_9CILI|nr:unnamed protein product [Blepharisma stoltei]